MQVDNDAFGQEIMAYHRGEPVQEIIERVDGLIGASPNPLNYFASYEDWMPQTQQAMEFVNGRILDIGCGAGRHALYLQLLGHEVVGIDNSPLAVQVCRERGVKDVRLLSITQASAKTLGIFDTIILMGNNFGLMGSFKRARWLLRRFYHMTGENGRIVAETTDPYQTDDPSHLAYQAANRKQGRMSGQLRLRVRYRAVKGSWFDYLLVSKAELEMIVSDMGWRLASTLGGDEKGRYAAVLEKD